MHQLLVLQHPLNLIVFAILMTGDMNEPLPVIYYASRTHSQLSQSVREIKNTAYKPRTVVLGSRDQLCVNLTVNQLPQSSRTGMCRSLVKKNKCSFYLGQESINLTYVDPVVRHEQQNSIMDIEELVTFGISKTACPFYLSAQAQQTAEIIFLPYNYLIDSQSRKSQKIFSK